jgi:hypothetical protein
MNPQNSPTSFPAAEGTATGDATTESSTLAETKTEIAQAARDAASKVKSSATHAVTRAKEEAERFASEKKETAATRIGNYSSAIHETARSLEEKDPNIAWFSHRAADRLQGVADYLRNRDFSSLRHDAEDVARRPPAAFFGGMFLAGLIAGNLVKASRRKLDESSDDAGGSDYRGNWSRPEMQPELTEAERAAAGI